MSAKKPAIGDVLHCEAGSAVVVEPGCTPLDGLLTLLEESYGDRFTEANPVVLAALPSARVETWWSCRKAWIEANGVDDEWVGNWWSSDGDGSRRITVAWFDGDVCALGDDAADAAEAGESIA